MFSSVRKLSDVVFLQQKTSESDEPVWKRNSYENLVVLQLRVGNFLHARDRVNIGQDQRESNAIKTSHFSLLVEIYSCKHVMQAIEEKPNGGMTVPLKPIGLCVCL